MPRFSRILLVTALSILLRSGGLGVDGHVSHAAAATLPVLSPVTALPSAAHVISFQAGAFVYTPADITIFAGEDVEWSGPFSFHPLVSDDALWATVGTGDSFTHTFPTPGAYRYHCAIHGLAGGIGMSGIVRVVPKEHRVLLPLILG